MITMAKKKGDDKKDTGTPDIENINGFIGKFLEEANRNFSQVATPSEPVVFGFNIRIGENGVPVVENFGNIKSTSSEVQLAETREPLIDVIERGDELIVMAEMPGVRKDSIELSLKGDTLEIGAFDGGRSYHKSVKLPYKVNPKNFRHGYNNGVLEVTLHKF